MLDTARPGVPGRDSFAVGVASHVRGVERYGAALSRRHGGHLRRTGALPWRADL